LEKVCYVRWSRAGHKDDTHLAVDIIFIGGEKIGLLKATARAFVEAYKAYPGAGRSG
jgi:hypothetical protein